MKKEHGDDTYIVIKDEKGMDFLCPAKTDNERDEAGLDVNVCFERDVPERYAGRITIQES